MNSVHNYKTADEKIRKYILEISGVPIDVTQDAADFIIASHEALRHLLEIELEKNGDYREL